MSGAATGQRRSDPARAQRASRRACPCGNDSAGRCRAAKRTAASAARPDQATCASPPLDSKLERTGSQ
eukprot:14682881-Alexandrium_andersonii.AAC.1